MAEKYSRKLIIGLTLLFILFTGCLGGGSNNLTDQSFGDLELAITLPITIKAHQVTVSLSHPSTGTVENKDLQITNLKAAHTFKNLKTGKWNLLLVLKDENGEEIDSAFDSTTILKDKITKLAIQVESTNENWFGKPTVQPSLLSINEVKKVWFRTLVNLPADKLSGVELFAMVDGEWQSKGYLFDNGELYNGDEIKGDRIFSGYFDFQETKAGILPLKIVVTLADGSSYDKEFEIEFVDTSLLDEAQITETKAFVKEKLESMDPDSSVDEMLTELATILESESDIIADTSVQGNILEIEYTTGLKSLILLTDETKPLKGGGLGKTAVAETEPKREEGQIPLNLQTRGNTVDFSDPDSNVFTVFATAENQLESRSILFWSPFATEFAPYEESKVVKPIFTEAALGFDVTVMEDFACSVESLLSFPEYGMIIMSTHGSGGRWLLTGELFDKGGKYLEEQLMNQISVCQEMKKTQSGDIIVKEAVYAVNDTWLNFNLIGEFANTIIVNSSCESTKTSNLRNVFENLGAGAYFGFSEAVYSDFAVEKVRQLSEGLVKGKTINESYKFDTDPNSGAAWQFYGNGDLYFKEGLLNGSFEEGLNAWTTDGDGRVITNLGFLNPTHKEKMGIISTGLGFTEAHGSITQTFVVDSYANKLKFDWNFLSEEFLEFIGSQYMDWFKVSLIVEGDTIVLFEKNIDDIAADFGATKPGHYFENETGQDNSGGNLIHVSPDIVFDRGDVWMTDWQSFSCDFSEYRGKKVTLTFGCHDIGDSAYDTAILLDNIRIE